MRNEKRLERAEDAARHAQEIAADHLRYTRDRAKQLIERVRTMGPAATDRDRLRCGQAMRIFLDEAALWHGETVKEMFFRRCRECPELIEDALQMIDPKDAAKIRKDLQIAKRDFTKDANGANAR